ncbi:hypothetical protein QW41_02610 [Salmonella enterica]|nr:hypothetical protein [Salmonella enterica]EBP3673431.1 hypothetical protein [Salmonella enterica subsp. enterica]EAW9359114.1 hypothetical protein [Salmonella enterica]EAW9419678.1 hypothetical protein [Salmonella enterica]EAW9425750.1 hypothetical protein [Salmonella enterica]
MANVAMNAHGQVFSCASCGCWLVLLMGGHGEQFLYVLKAITVTDLEMAFTRKEWLRNGNTSVWYRL